MEQFEKLPAVGDLVEDYAYGLGMNFTGKIVEIKRGKVIATLYPPKPGFFQRLLFPPPPSMENRILRKKDFNSLYGWEKDHWELDTFL